MSLVPRSQAGQRLPNYVYAPVFPKNSTSVDEIQACTAVAIEAFSQGLLHHRYINQFGIGTTISSSQELGPLMRSGLILRSSGDKLYLARVGLLGGGPLDELEKKLQNKPADKKSVFISYQWAQKDIARDIQDEFEKKGFLVIRDESNLSHGVYLPGFMRILNHPNLDYVLVIVSDSYMKSKNCMYEVNQMISRYSFADTLLPFVMTDDPSTRADIYNGVQNYLVYWRNKLEEAKAIQDVANEEVIQNIIKNCQAFADAIRTRINVSEADLKNQRYQPFFDLVDQREKEKMGGIFKEIEMLLIKAAGLEIIDETKEAEETYTLGLKKIKDSLYLDGMNPLRARFYGAYSEFLAGQNKPDEAQKNLRIAKKFGYPDGSNNSSSSSSAAAVQLPAPVASSSSSSSSVPASERSSLLAAVELNPAKFIEASKVLKSEADMKSLVNAFAFGKDKWEKYFGVIDRNIPELPNNIAEILCSEDPYFPGKKHAETRMLVLLPTTVNGKPLNLKSFRELIKAPRAGNKSDYQFIRDKIETEYDSKSPVQAQWVLMTKDVIPGSRHLSYKKQKGMVEKISQNEVPDILSGTVAILTHYARTGERLFSDSPWTYTRCKEVAGGYQTAVGGFASAGLSLKYDCDSYDRAGIAVAAVRKF